MNDNNALLAYWPGRERIDECLRTEAETADEALLLAVHEPVTLLRRPEQSGAAVTEASEMDLLHTLMRPADDGSAVLVAITGASGVGKSHMVRWLKAQLERHPRRQELVIVTIPKTASLRRVVELILEPLASAEYEALRQDLARAAEAMNPVLAAELLATTLAEELEPYGKRLEEEVRARRVGPEFGPRIRLAQHLRTLLRDPDVRDAWLQAALRRIVSASLGGTDDPADRQFKPKDLEPPVESAATPMKSAVNEALAFLANANGRYRGTAAEILQELLDPALRTIFRFTDALHQRSLDEIVDDIRQQLLRDGKELVLLIEDLAALSGIQEPLLKIVIAESDHQGVRVRAPIRTVLAVTDGFLAGRKTVLTRAREQWEVPSEGLAESIIVQRLVSLTGRYLNAARWGVAHLRQAFRASPQEGVDLYGWVPCFDETLDAAAADRLDAFGRNAIGHSLFPFNEAAVRSLAAAALKAGDAWTFRPRTFINEVLRKTLLERALFEDGLFPPPNFHQARLTAELDQELQFRGYGAEETRRLRTALFHWAGHPRSLAVASVARPVFDAFDLPWPFSAAAKPPTGAPAARGPSGSGASITVTAVGIGVPATVTPVPPPEPVHPAAAPPSAYAQALEKWTPEARMTGEHPRLTRRLLTEALNERIDFDDYRLHGQRVEPTWFWLPPANTVSNPTQDFAIHVAEPGEPIPPLVVAGLKALERWSNNGRSWNYAQAENDYASANALLEQLEVQVLSAMLEEAERDGAALASALHRQNLLLGASARQQPEPGNLKDLLAQADDHPPPEAAERLPAKARTALEARRKSLGGREQLQERLRHYLGCYQGNTGGKLLAVDTERLKSLLRREVPQRWVLGLKARGPLSLDAQDAMERLSPQQVGDLTAALAIAVEQLQPIVAQAFGNDHQRGAWREAMLQTIDEARELSMWPPAIDEAPLRTVVARLSDEATDSALRRVRKMESPDVSAPVNARLVALCGIPLTRLATLAVEVSLLQEFFDALEGLVRAQTRSVDDEQALQQRAALINSVVWED